MTVDLIKLMSSAEELLSDDTFMQIAEEQAEADKEKLFCAVLDKAKELKCLQNAKNMVAAWKRDIKRSTKSAIIEKTQAYDCGMTKFGYGDCEFECGPFQADDNGVIYVTPFGDHLVCYHPILVKKVLKNAETDKEKVRLAYRKGSGDWKEITVDRSTIASANKIVALADSGLSVDTETAKYLVKYLSYIENHNLHLVDYGKSTSKFGWIDLQFTPYDDFIEFDAKNVFPDLYRAVYEHRGEYKEWIDFVKDIRKGKRDEPRLYIAGAFASILLRKLNALPFVLNLWGETGKGKTVALMLACSVFADPCENRYITDPSSTTAAIEVRENLLNNLPLMIDDLSKIKDTFKKDEGFTDFIYMLCGGKGKDRSNVNLGLNRTTTWQNVCLTNIERPLATETMRGGAINRILDFEMEEGSIFDNGNEVVRFVSKHYGHAGEHFVRIIQCMNETELKSMYDGYVDKIREIAKKKGVEKEEKQIIPLAIMLTADKIATDEIFEDGIYLDIDKCVDALKDKGEVSENKRALYFIQSAVAVNSSKFIKVEEGAEDSTEDVYRNEYWGIFKGEWTIINSNIFDKICEDGNFSRKGFLIWAKKHNFLETDKKERGRTTKVTKINGVPTRCVWLRLPCGDIDEYGFMEVSDTKDIPFD